MQLPETFLSLRQMCFAKTALMVFNDPEVRHFVNTHDIHNCIWTSEEIESLLGKEPATLLKNAHVNEILSKRIIPNLSQEYKRRFSGDGKHHSLPNKQWEILVDQKLTTLSLPNIFKKEVMALVRLVLIESYKWLEDHKTTTDSATKLQNHFHWTQDNKIDRHKTAKAIIADDNINNRYRFLLASYYCFQEDVFSIWEILDDVQRNFFQRLDLNIVQIWVNWVQYGEDINWEEIVRISRFGLQTYFPKLEREKRIQYLMRYGRGIWNNYHELKSCLSILDQNEQNEILKNCAFQVIEVFLDWPVHGKLLDVVKLLWPYLAEQNFRDLFDVILCQKRLFNWIGYDYITLVKKLHIRVPFESRKFIEKDTIYKTLIFALEYDRSPFFPRAHSNDDNFIAIHSGTTAFVISKYKGDFLSFSLPLHKTFYLYLKRDVRCFIQE
ncbi:uncharacterized protein TNIN_262651 [Trichonephila inaurata madagascariensis]|uniref:Uncharacterized protein n=1 Tax=Trichonephila inaurata madagascariensis TaxID=2747483 RepID=A0A8X7BW78_9ARAC|nr:uncharacterized protein TNIN_262651 [Trichonephila inaurata madagascariensis]